MIAVLFAHLRVGGGEELVLAVTRGSGDCRSLPQLVDPERWSTYDQVRTLFEVAAELTGDRDIGRQVGAAVYLRARSAEVLDRLRALGHPGVVLRDIAETSSRQSRVTRMECLAATSRHALVAASTVPPHERHRVFCDYIAGMLAAVPTIFGMNLAQVVEVECTRRGDARCLYDVSWEPTSERAVEVEAEALGRRLEELTGSFEALKEMASELVAVGDRNAVLQTIAEQAAMAVRAERYLLAVRLPHEEAARVHAIGFAPGEALRSAERLLAEDSEIAGRDCLVVDVVSSNYAFGKLAAYQPKAGRFLPEEARLLAAYAGHAAAVLESTTALAAARERAETMSALFALATELAEVTVREDVARRLARAMHAVADCDEVSVYTWDGGSSQLSCAGRSRRASADELPEYRPDLTSFAGCDDLVERVTAHPEAIDVAEIASDPVLAGVCGSPRAATASSCRSSPRGDCFGLVALSSPSGRRVGSATSMHERLAGVAGLAATAFHNARLLDEIRHQALHDALTGLSNRALVLDRVEQAHPVLAPALSRAVPGAEPVPSRRPAESSLDAATGAA